MSEQDSLDSENSAIQPSANSPLESALQAQPLDDGSDHSPKAVQIGKRDKISGRPNRFFDKVAFLDKHTGEYKKRTSDDDTSAL